MGTSTAVPIPAGHGRITDFIDGARRGQSAAYMGIWNYYRARILHFAYSRLRNSDTAVADEEDVTTTVFLNVFCRLRAGCYPNLKTREDLWRLLRKVAANCASSQRRHLARKKRGGDSRTTSNVENCEDRGVEFQELTARDSFEHFLSLLPTDEMKLICLLRSEGMSITEIAEQTGRSAGTISRRVEAAQQYWQQAVRDFDRT